MVWIQFLDTFSGKTKYEKLTLRIDNGNELVGLPHQLLGLSCSKWSHHEANTTTATHGSANGPSFFFHRGVLQKSPESYPEYIISTGFWVSQMLSHTHVDLT